MEAETFITRLAWISKGDDPCSVASQAAGIMRALLDERAELMNALREMTEDLEARWDMRDRRTNPGIKHCVQQARTVIAKADGRA